MKIKLKIDLVDKLQQLDIAIDKEKNIIKLNDMMNEKNELLRMWGQHEYHLFLKGGE